MLSSSARLSNRQMKLTHTTLLTDDWLNNYTIDHMYSTSVLQLSLQIELKLEQIIQPRSLVEPFLLSIKANAAHVITAAFKTLVLALWRCFRQGKFQVGKKKQITSYFSVNTPLDWKSSRTKLSAHAACLGWSPKTRFPLVNAAILWWIIETSQTFLS